MKNHPEIALQRRIDKKELQKLYKTRPFLHLFAMLAEWGIIIGAAILCQMYFHPVLYFFTVVLIGSRMHAMTVLMHDASHHRFFKDRKLSDLLTNIFIMYPIFASLKNYRQNHFKHHQHLNSDKDPDWVVKEGRPDFTFPVSRKEFYLRLLSYLFFIPGIKDALWFLKRFKDPHAKPDPFKARLGKLSFYVLVVIGLSVFALWSYFGMYWVVPYFTTFFMFQYIRSVAEHFGDMAHENEFNSTRTVIPAWWEMFLIAPYYVHFHIEHHLYPAVPFYNLPKLHKMLLADEQYAQTAHFTKGYVRGFVRELVR